MDSFGFHDGSITNLIKSRDIHCRHDFSHDLRMHSSLLRRLTLEKELEGHLGCVNSIAWNVDGSLLVSGSDDTQINIWSYSSQKLIHSIETGHSTNIFCTKFVPETSDELVVSGAGDAEVRVFNLSHLMRNGLEEGGVNPSAVFRCHTRRVKKLAVEVGNPNVVWSASEDGTLRQHDFRENASCPPAGSSHQECRNILLDLRRGAKKSLEEPPKQCLALKSCDISSTRPNLLLVGGSDTLARLYDRRMLPILSSSQEKLQPPPCVNYFCPKHLSYLGNSSLHLTHVAFSPTGEEVLLSYSGEYVYLMDANLASAHKMSYTPRDVSKLSSLSSLHDGVSLDEFLPRNRDASSANDKCRKFIHIAKKALKGETDYFYGIEACNEIVDYYGHEIGRSMMHEVLCIRASLFLKRRWRNDSQMAIRDCNRALKMNPSSTRALVSIADALSMHDKHKEALDFASVALSLSPTDSAIMEKVENIKKAVAAVAEAEKGNMESDATSSANYQAGTLVSVSDIIYGIESDDASWDAAEREDYSFDNDDFEASHETTISPELDMARQNGFAGFTGSSCGNGEQPYQPEMAIDMKQRYVGHCNVGTDIKQASFIGQRGNYVASGSDDGRWFIWEKKTGRLVKILRGDDTVVNCIQSHPYDCTVATSGIDNTIKIWTPTSPVSSIVAAGAAGPEASNPLDVMQANQHRLCNTREAILPFEILERFRMHEFSDGNFQPFECTQA